MTDTTFEPSPACVVCGGTRRISHPGTATGWHACPECASVAQPELVTNAKGGTQSHIAERLDLIPPECELLLGQCLGFGAEKYGQRNWQKIDEADHLNHALVHIRKWQAGDRTEPHLVNALARTTFALWCAIDAGDQPREYNHPDLLGTVNHEKS